MTRDIVAESTTVTSGRNTADELQAAVETVKRYARDDDEKAMFLDQLGLTEELK